MGSGAKVRIDWIASSSCSVGLSGGLLRYWGQWIRSIIENVSMFSILLKTLKHFQFWHASQPYFISIENVYNLLYVALAHLVWYEAEDTFCDWGVRGGHALAAVVAASSPTYKPFHPLDSVQRISMRNYDYIVYKFEYWGIPYDQDEIFYEILMILIIPDICHFFYTSKMFGE